MKKQNNIKSKLYLFPHVYYKKSLNGEFILYNTQTGTVLEMKSIECQNIVDNIYIPENLGAIDYNKEDFDTLSIRLFVKEIQNRGLGGIIELKNDNQKFVNLLPILNLQTDFDKPKSTNQVFSIHEDLLKYLNEINIFINNTCSMNCIHCNKYYQQTRSCYKEENKHINLDFSIIENLLKVLEHSSLKKINILGGNPFLYPEWNKLTQLFRQFKFEFHIWMHHMNDHEVFFENIKKKHIVTPPFKKSIIKNLSTKYEYFFFVEDEIQYNKIDENIPDQVEYTIIPIYTSTNLNFFKKNVFLDKEDIFEKTISQRMIFCNQKINSNFFGKLFIMPDASVCANQGLEPIGSLKTDTLLQCIYTELTRNTIWKTIREEEPCNNCNYQFLCPTLSKYESVIGKYNLCNIR